MPWTRDEMAARAARELRDGIARIQEELQVTPEFPEDVMAAAAAAAAAPRMPDLDRTDLPVLVVAAAGFSTCLVWRLMALVRGWSAPLPRGPANV